MKNIKSLISPQSIAVVGVSEDKAKVGRVVYDNLKKSFSGQIIAINPKKIILDNHTALASLNELENQVDLAIICIPAQFVPQAIKDCQVNKITNAVIISAGFSETGEKGQKLTGQITQAANRRVNILGPNTLGFYNLDLNLNATFADYLPVKGRVSFISQSGAFMTAFLDWAEKANVGLAKAVCVGNKLDVNENHLLAYLDQDPQTQMIAVYLESFADGQEFMQLATKIKKPIIILKGGQSEAGKQRAMSHTASMSGSAQIASAVFKKINAVEAKSIEEFFNLVYVFSKNIKLPGRRVGVITNAGGPGVILTDMFDQSPLVLAELEAKTLNQLKSDLPVWASFKNPIDIIGDAQPNRYEKTIQTLSTDNQTDFIINVVSPQSMTDIPGTAKTIARLGDSCEKPLVNCFLGGKKTQQALTVLAHTNQLVFPFLNPMMAGLSRLYQYQYQSEYPIDRQLQPEIKDLKIRVKKEVESGAEKLSADLLSDLAQAYQINLSAEFLISDQQELLEISQKINSPLVLKTLNIHKTEDKQVYLNLQTENELSQAFEALRRITRDKLLVQPMIKGEVELLLGSSLDPDFGPSISFGLGGIYTEALNQVVNLIPPLGLKEAQDLVKNQGFYHTFENGYRNLKRPEEKVWQTLINFSCLVSNFPEVKSFEINPLMVTESEVFAVDFRALI